MTASRSERLPGDAALRVTGLHSGVESADGAIPIVRGVDLEVAPGETLGLVGESGSGKSFTALSVADLLPDTAHVSAGSVVVNGADILAMSRRDRQRLRGARIGMVYQDPMTSLNPMMRIGVQVSEGLTAHGWSKAAARSRTIEVLGEVGLPSPESMARLYPHQLSGGMRQRVLIAAALAPRPSVLIADEPTTALDVTIQQQILAVVARLRDEYGLAIVWITHDLGVLAQIADRVSVMYAGRVVEHASIDDLFQRPTHPYTAGLLASIPSMGDTERGDLSQIGGTAATMTNLSRGCPFAPRCPQRRAECTEAEPGLMPRDRSLAACWVPPEEWT